MPNLQRRYRSTFVALLLSAAHSATVHAIPGQPGTLDATFGAASPLPGSVVTIVQPPDANKGKAAAQQPDGKVVVAGTCTDNATSIHWFCMAVLAKRGGRESRRGWTRGEFVCDRVRRRATA